MKVLAVAADDSSGHYRIRLPVEALHDDDVHVEVLTKEFPVTRNRDGTYAFTPDCDVLVIQRPMHEKIVNLIDHVQAQGIAVVVEADDDFHTVQANNIAFFQHHPKADPRANFHHFAECVKRADLVTVSTPALVDRYGSHGRIALLRNYVSSDWTLVPRHNDGHTIGWAGTTLNHPTDLQATRGGVSMAMDDHPDWRFVCVGGGHFPETVWKQLRLDKERCEVTEWRPLGLHELVMSQFDIGIAPLDDIVFNHAKSWLKGLEYAALGIPFVASDLPEYVRLEKQHGIGVTAPSKSKAWRRRVGDLMSAGEGREALGQAYRTIVASTLTIERNAWRWPEAWQRAIEERRRRTANTRARPK
jgi:Glycosyl transferases group 1